MVKELHIIDCHSLFFQLYKQILRQKLAWSMQDWMGMVLFGTEKNDANSPWTNIQTLQELKVVTVDDLQRIRKLSKYNYNQC